MSEREHLIALTTVPGIGPTRTRRLLKALGSAQAAWQASATELLTAGLDDRVASALIATRASLDPACLPERLARAQTRALVQSDDDYPARLAELDYSPPVLYVRGDLLPTDQRAVAIVGTRRASAYGREVARTFATELAAAGVTVVSGLALGIDGEAHQAALEAGGRTLAVLGCGPDIVYPPRHARLAEAIIERGALVSEYFPGTKPDAVNFPARNRWIAGLSLGVLVAEAPARSGALITADLAADQGRQVFAVPGSVLSPHSAGCHALLRVGATLVTTAAELLEDLNLANRAERAAGLQLPLIETTADEHVVLRLISAEPVHIDDLCRASGLPVSTLNATLTMMEIKGLVRQAARMSYVLG